MKTLMITLLALAITQTSLASKLKKTQEKIDFHSAIVETQMTAQEYSKELKKNLSLNPEKKRNTIVFVQPKNEVEVIVAPATDYAKPTARPSYKSSKKLEKKQFERLADEFSSFRE